MWGSNNNYGVINGGGDRSLGDYTEKQRQLNTVYEIAEFLSKTSDNEKVYASLDVNEGDYVLGQSDKDITGLYGLEPYIFAKEYQPTVLVNKPYKNKLPQSLNASMPVNMLRTILRKIVEEA